MLLPKGSIECWPFELRPWAGPDVTFLFDACQDPDVQTWTTVPRPYRPGHAAEFIAQALDERIAGSGLHLAITNFETGELYGSIALKDIGADPTRVEAGYWLAPEGRRRGAATAALDALCAWAAEHLGVAEVFLRIQPGNTASQGVAHRAGFELVDQPVGYPASRCSDCSSASIWRRSVVRAPTDTRMQ